MNNEKLYALAGELDDRFIAETMKPRAARRRYLRYAAAAAALLLIFGAAFGVVKAAGAGNTPVVPKDAVLPPTQVASEISDLMYVRAYDMYSMYNRADAVCVLTIKNWLGEDDSGTYFEATVERLYKGDLPERIVLFQMGNSEYTLEDSPLFTYGDRILVGLIPWENDMYENAYDLVGTDSAMLYVAESENGEAYLVDHKGLLGMNNDRSDSVILDNYADDSRLAYDIISQIEKNDPAIAKRLKEYFGAYYDDIAGFIGNGMLTPHIYSLDEVESTLNDW